MKKQFFTPLSRAILISFFCSLILFNCTRIVEDPQPEQVVTDVIDEELMAAIGAIPTGNYRLADLMLPSGESVLTFLQENDPEFLAEQKRLGGRLAAVVGPQAKKNLIIARMQTVAYRLCDRNKFYPKGSYANEPEHYGLAYSFGQRNYTIRAAPPTGACRMYKVFGLDCSGFIYNVFKESGFDMGLPITANKQRDTLFLRTLFQKDPDLAKIKVKDLGQIPLNDFKAGDIVYWKPSVNAAASHIGIVLLDKTGNKGIFQSNGTGTNSNKCLLNFTDTKGCRQVPTDAANGKDFGKVWGIVRVIVDITGKYEIQLKCDWADANDIAAKFDIEFKMSEKDDAVTGKGTGTDYDGERLNIEFKGQYDQANNLLKGRFFITKPGDPLIRQDDLSVVLNKDDTGFITLQNVVRAPNTCIAQVRLINKSDPKGGRVATGKETLKLTPQPLF
jgi:hypothetical protein